MCGLAGVWHRRSRRPVTDQLLTSMGERLAHRGPDDFGVYCHGAVGLAHTRLAVIDLTGAGHQPMRSNDGRYVIVFNGEIYNFAELQQRYLLGRKLKSASDTEVLLYLLADHGEKILPHLRGMFAFAFWDSYTKELLLARDPFGKKPLCWTDRNGVFAFGSEVKAILAHPDIPPQADAAAMTKYFLYEYIPAPATGFKGINQLPMGSWLKVSAGSIKEQRWWQPKYQPKLETSEEEAIRQLDHHLAVAVSRRMVADVPVGVFLSGGLDSSTVTWYMRQHTSTKLHSFSVAFAESSFDESYYAQLAAKALGTQHHSLQFGVKEFINAIEYIVPRQDILLSDASLLPTYAISRLAREHITVVLDGDGSDELLAGYGTFVAAQLAERLPTLPGPVLQTIQQLARHIPTSYRNFSLDFKIKSFLKGLGYSLPYRNQIWLGSFSDKVLPDLLAPAWQTHIASVFTDIKTIEPQLAGLGVTDAVSLLKIYHYLNGDLLVKLDRATMLVSLEARTPFLDVDVAEFAMRLPERLKRNKYILKRLMTGRIPAEIISRPKRGFGVPLGHWLRGPLYSWVREILDPGKLASDGILEGTYVQGLLEAHRAGKQDLRKQIWTLIMWQLWFDFWIAGRR